MFKLCVIFSVCITFALMPGCSLYSRSHSSGSKGLQSYTVRGKTYYPLQNARGFSETGTASWYGPGFHGKITSNGERYNQHDFTAAHKLLPFGTRLQVTNMDNGKIVEVRINDRGPFVGNRIIDLSRSAAEKLGMLEKGTARVRLIAIHNENTPVIFTANGDMQGIFYVQIGAFNVQSNADNLTASVRKEGYGCRIIQHDGDRRHFVQLGPYLSRSQAESIVQKVFFRFPGAFVIAQ